MPVLEHADCILCNSFWFIAETQKLSKGHLDPNCWSCTMILHRHPIKIFRNSLPDFMLKTLCCCRVSRITVNCDGSWTGSKSSRLKVPTTRRSVYFTVLLFSNYFLGKFNWKGTIKAVLKQAPDNEISIKKLRKKVQYNILFLGFKSSLVLTFFFPGVLKLVKSCSCQKCLILAEHQLTEWLELDLFFRTQ